MNMEDCRKDFPTIRKNLGIYLDNACQTLRPDQVIDAMNGYYEEYPACGGRSVHSMATKVSVSIDETREALASFFGTDDPDCYIFTKNTTEGLNTVAFGLPLKKGDAVVTTDTEHNSNHVPWIVLKEKIGIERRFSKSDKDGVFDIESFKKCMDNKVKAVSIQQTNNVTGSTIPVKDVAEIAHDHGAIIVVDGAQSAAHIPIDLKKLDVDVFCCSAHKMLGPSGMGIMYGKKEILEKIKPLTYGGGTVGLSTYDSSTMAEIPERFEAGLLNYSGIIGTKAALDYLSKIGMDNIAKNDSKLMKRVFGNLEDVKNLHVVGPSDPTDRCGVFSFNIDGLVSHDIAMMLDNMANIMIRSGMHCTHPFYVSRSIEGSARASTYLYNTEREMDTFTDAVKKIAEDFGERS